MKCINLENKIIFKFGIFHKLVIDIENRKIYGRFGEIAFEEVVGAWKNFRRTHKNVDEYYIQILTSKRIYTVTPLLKKESDARRVLLTLKNILKIEKIRV